jgi:hypothetical protein
MSPSRFFRNILNSFTNTRLRIPPDPETAYRKLCGNKAAITLPKPGSSRVSTAWTATDPSTASLGRNDAADVQRDVRYATRTPVRSPRITALSGFV